MKKTENEYGAELDPAGYAPSIIQRETCCANCGRRWGYGMDRKLDRHEPWGGTANRAKSKELGMWVYLCHFGCHEGPGSVHDDAQLARQFRKDAQRAAMLRYGWSREEFIRRFGKSELSEDEAAHIIPKNAFTHERKAKIVGQSAGGFRVLFEEPALPY